MRSCIVFSVPRSGTHLVMKLLHYLGLKEWYPDVLKNGLLNIFNMPSEGYYCFGAHLPASDTFKEALTKSNLKAIYILRNPRAVTVSQVKYYSTRPSEKYIYEALQNYTEDEAIKKIIEGISVFKPLSERYKMKNGWMNHPNVYTTHFERLVGNKGNGSDETQYFEIKNIASHLNIDISDKHIHSIQQNLFGNELYTNNFRQGKIDDWKNYWTEEHEKLFKKYFNSIY